MTFDLSTFIFDLLIALVPLVPNTGSFSGYANGCSSPANGDTINFSTLESKLADVDVDKMQPKIIAVRRKDGSDIVNFGGTKMMYYKFTDTSGNSLKYGNYPRRSSTTPYALTEADALAGKWTTDGCRLYDICNFGKHC